MRCAPSSTPRGVAVKDGQWATGSWLSRISTATSFLPASERANLPCEFLCESSRERVCCGRVYVSRYVRNQKRADYRTVKRCSRSTAPSALRSSTRQSPTRSLLMVLRLYVR